MSTWDRFKRVVRSNLGRLQGDPLRPRDYRHDVQALEQNVAAVRELLAQLEGDLQELRAQEERISTRIRQSLQAGDREAALDEADRLRRVREDIARVTSRLEKAQQACARAEGVHQEARRELAADQELRARAEATVARLEQEDTAGGKTLGTDSGPSPLVEGPARAPAEQAKTMGGAGLDDAVEVDASAPAVKTIGPAPSRTEAARTDAASSDLLDELERLGKLREQGLLTADEFDAAKKRLLGS